MKNKIIKFFLTPNAVVIVLNYLFTALGVAGCIITLTLGYFGWASYFIYAFAGVSLAYSVYITVRFSPKIKTGVINFLKKRKFTRNIIENYSYKSIVFATFSLILNIALIVFNIVYGVIYKSVWYGTASLYYFLLGFLRASIIFAERKAKNSNNDSTLNLKRIKIYKYCGLSLFILELGVLGVVTLSVMKVRVTSYSQIFAIVLAFFTFYKLTLSIINSIKTHKTENLTLYALRNIGLADAGVSVISLQMALISTFSTGENLTALNAIVGFSVTALTIVLGIVMIIKGRKIENSNYNIK